ncbi:hypothetical protein EXIGLDRAFT_804517 [Exidia glandulosa HHB12029]|uniref:F-box domain-containing protein n=1 Tax=Exidia glandulosa HHB12029 TaxID=1314781 RepID=A0A165DUK6_EXIGL|nr:hypothetical protein EXIGLDRAFT_804517 [Exidia glandulosa HHB12029]
MRTSSPYPHVVVHYEGWDDITLLDVDIVPALRYGPTKTLRVITDEALLIVWYALDLDDPNYTIYHTWGYNITSLHIERADTPNLAVETKYLFYALAKLPSLVELTISVNRLPHIAPVTETATIPFHLARLNLNPVFCGWPRLVAQSTGTLRELVLHGARATALEDGAFLTTDESKAYSASLRSVRHLRLSNVFDPAIVRGCPSLRTLDLNCVEPPMRGSNLSGVITCLDVASRPLQNLVIGLHPLQPDFALVKVFDLLPLRLIAVAGLRSVTIQPCRERLPRFQDVLEDGGRRARDVLQNFCREHRISLSLH